MATGYRYTPLDLERQEIRLLCFDSRLLTSTACFDEPLRCTIKHISTLPDPLPEYYAVSYTWGDSKTRGALLVDGKRVTIPRNAETALRHLLAHQLEQRTSASPSAILTDSSSTFVVSPTPSLSDESPGSPAWPDTEIRFWLDAMCINQHDLEEKSAQLLLVSDIYSQAREVSIWLGGEDDDDSDEDTGRHVSRSISAVVETCKAETNDLADLFETVWQLSAKELSPRAAYAPLPKSCDVSALRAVYSSPWFQRLWVLQECTLARNPQCYRGRHTVPFHHVALAARWIWYRTLGRLSPDDRPTSAHTIGIQNAATMWDMISTPFVVPRVLSSLLLLGLRFDVTDPRDKVYAVLGLLNDRDFAELQEDLVPNYSVSLAELYTRATRAVIEESQSLFVVRVGSTLVSAAEWREDALDLPSWVPRFDWIYNVDRGSPARIGAAHKATGCDFGIRMRNIDSLSSVLAVQGMPVDEIAVVTLGFRSYCKDDGQALKTQVVNAWGLSVEQCRGKQDVPLEAAFAHTICAGRDERFRDSSNAEGFHASCAAFFMSCGAGCKRLTDYFSESGRKDSVASAASPGDFAMAIAQNTRNLAFFITADGRLGMGPKRSRGGDQVCILPGCDVPVVLRREGAFWRYVGDAYVYGLMNGEWFQGRARLGRLEAEMQWFNIH